MGAVRMIVAARTDVGRERKNNEDAYAITDLATGTQLTGDAIASAIDVRDKGVLLAVSDGMGGHQAGEVASALVLDSLRAAMESITATGGATIEEKIEKAVLRANAEVARAARDQNRQGMGATLTAVFAQGGMAYVAEVGDSRAYLLRAGRLRQITRDQSLVQMLVEGGVISPEEARTSPRKNVVLQAMGLADDVRVAIGRLLLRQGDTLFLCSDGVSNFLTDEELREVLLGGEPAETCERVIVQANERGGEDNLTAIVARFDGTGLIRPKASESVTSTFQVIREYEETPFGTTESRVDDDDDEPPPTPPPPPSASSPKGTEPAGSPVTAPAPAEARSRTMSVAIVVVSLLVAAAILLAFYVLYRAP